jgi:predicted transcriptional regulator
MTEIDEVVKEEWIEDTDSFDRVKTVLRQTTQHKSANEISKIAEVSEKTAKKNLDKLAGLNVAEKISTGNGFLYRRSKDWYLNKEIDRLRKEATIEEIKNGIERMNDDISEYRDRYGVEKPEDLLVQLGPDDGREAWVDLSEWETTEKNLAIAKAAVRFEEASNLVEPDEAAET